MFWNSIPNNERLRLWKKLREDVADLPLVDQLKEIAKFAGTIPFGSRSIDYYTPEDWPTPWEILYHDMFCTSSISVLIFHTFVLLKTTHKIDLYLVEDSDDVYLLPIINDQFVLNYESGKISNYSEIKDQLKVLQVFDQTRVKTIK